jgi:hypothetical protein
MEAVLGGLVIAIVSGIAGNFVGKRDTIKCNECDGKQKACQALLLEKIGNVAKEVNALTTAVNSKLLGI